MKKIFTLLAIAMMAVTSAWADNVLTADKTTCKVGESVTLTYTSTYTSGDDFFGCNVYINGEQEGTVNQSPFTYTFTPSAAGTYIFYFICQNLQDDGEDGYIPDEINSSQNNEVTITVEANTSVSLGEENTEYPSVARWDESKTYDITVARSLNHHESQYDYWNSLCLPFGMTAQEISDNHIGDVMKMTSIEDNVVNFTSAETIEAGKMYIVKPVEGYDSEIKVTGKTGLKNYTDGSTLDGYALDLTDSKNYATFTYGNWYIKSEFVKSTVSQENNKTTYVLSNNKFYTVDEQGLEIKGFRWYIQNNSGSQAKAGLGISFDGETTGLTTADIDAVAPTEGKYLENGRLVIKKNGKTFNAAGQRIN